jgi:hypothetical protein
MLSRKTLNDSLKDNGASLWQYQKKAPISEMLHRTFGRKNFSSTRFLMQLAVLDPDVAHKTIAINYRVQDRLPARCRETRFE